CPVPDGLRELLNALAGQYTGVVYQYVNAAKGLRHLRKRRPDRLRGGDVAGDANAVLQPGGRLRGLFGLYVEDRHPAAFLVQTLCDGKADTLRAAGNDGATPCKPHSRSSFKGFVGR